MIAIRYLDGPHKMGQPSRLFNGEPLKMAEHTWFSLGLFHPYAWNYFRPLLRTGFWGPPWQGAGTRKNRSTQLKFGTGQSITRTSFVIPLCEQSPSTKTQLILSKKWWVLIPWSKQIFNNIRIQLDLGFFQMETIGPDVHILQFFYKIAVFLLHPSNLLKQKL